METKETKTLRVFKSRFSPCNYIFKSGTVARFLDGVYYTENKNEIKELEDEIEFGHPHLYIDANMKEVEANKDPMAGLRKKIIDEYLQNQAAATDPSRDMGTTTKGPTGVMNTADLSSGISGAARTINVKKS